MIFHECSYLHESHKTSQEHGFCFSFSCVFDRYHEIHLFTVVFVITTAGKFRTWHVENRNREGFSVCLSISHHILSVNEADP